MPTDLDKISDALGHPHWCERRLTENARCDCGARDTARRVVEAMREPSDGMLKATLAHNPEYHNPGPDIPLAQRHQIQRAQHNWQAMCYHILKEQSCDT